MTSPLQALYTDKYNYQVFQFPPSIEPTVPDKGGYIVFFINIPVESHWNTNPPTGNVQPTMNRGAVAAKRFGLYSGSVVSSVEKALLTPQNLILESHTVRTTAMVALFMPNTMVWNQQYEWDTHSLSAMFPKLIAAESTLGEIAHGGDMSNLSGAALGALKAFGGAPSVITAGLAAAGLAFNPQNFLLFRQVDFRRFQFDFLLTPQNQKETEMINQIIYLFRFHSAPEIQAGGLGAYFIPPSEFDIQFVHDGTENTNIPKISTCVMTSVNVDYAASGQWSTTYDGAPQQVRLTLQFMEKEIMTKKTIFNHF